MMKLFIVVAACIGYTLAVRDVDETFQYFDYDKSDGLSINEFERVFLQFDGNGDRNITKSEFVSGWEFFELEGEFSAGFDFFELDRNGDGKVTADPDLNYLFHFFDDDSSKEVSIHEYRENWASLFGEE